jgi:hypothetical protein
MTKRSLSKTADNILLAIYQIWKDKKEIEIMFQGRPKKSETKKRQEFIDDIISKYCCKYNLSEGNIRKITGIK